MKGTPFYSGEEAEAVTVSSAPSKAVAVAAKKPAVALANASFKLGMNFETALIIIGAIILLECLND